MTGTIIEDSPSRDPVNDIQSHETSNTREYALLVRIVELAKRSQYLSDTISINLHDQCQDLILKLRGRQCDHLGTKSSWLRSTLHMLLMQRDCVFMATISSVGSGRGTLETRAENFRLSYPRPLTSKPCSKSYTSSIVS